MLTYFDCVTLVFGKCVWHLLANEKERGRVGEDGGGGGDNVVIGVVRVDDESLLSS